MTALPSICLRAICSAGLIICFVVLIGCTENVRTIENDAFKVTVCRLNPSALDPYIMSVYMEPKGEKQLKKTRLLKIEGPDDFEGAFISRNLLVLKSPTEPTNPSRSHFLLRVPMECISTIEIKIDDLIYGLGHFDTIPYAKDYSGNRRVSFDSTWLDKVFIVKTDDIAKVGRIGEIRIAPADKLVGELIHDDTLRLSVAWCGEKAAQEILVKLPTSIKEDLEYIVRE